MDLMQSRTSFASARIVASFRNKLAVPGSPSFWVRKELVLVDMKVVSLAFALASVVLVPCYGQDKPATKATKPAVKAPLVPVSPEKRFAQSKYDDALAELAKTESKINDLRLAEPARRLELNAKCEAELKKVDVELAPVHIQHSAEQQQECDDLLHESDPKRLELERVKGEITATLEVLKPRLDYADTCAKVYRITIDTKQSDVTVRQIEQMKACRSLELYPPEK
jgi:hypothetical protein